MSRSRDGDVADNESNRATTGCVTPRLDDRMRPGGATALLGCMESGSPGLETADGSEITDAKAISRERGRTYHYRLVATRTPARPSAPIGRSGSAQGRGRGGRPLTRPTTTRAMWRASPDADVPAGPPARTGGMPLSLRGVARLREPAASPARRLLVHAVTGCGGSSTPPTRPSPWCCCHRTSRRGAPASRSASSRSPEESRRGPAVSLQRPDGRRRSASRRAHR